ncbi:MAG: hypothetical protein NVSMB22_19060 [Chloroflexota bacterium]
MHLLRPSMIGTTLFPRLALGWGASLPETALCAAAHAIPVKRQWRDALIVLGWALALRLMCAVITADTYDPDEFVVLVLGRDFAHGATPYRDFMFFHPPGVLVLFRLLQPLTTWWWPLGRVAMILIDTVTAVCVWRIGTLLYGRREGLAAGLLYAASPLALICSVRVGQDPIITALGVGGLLLLLSTRSQGGAALAGVCLGLAVWMKYPAILFLPVYILAAPRRALVSTLASIGTVLLAFAPFLSQAHAVFEQTIVWQLSQRKPLDLGHRFGAVAAFWLLLNPLAVLAVLRRRQPLWLLGGFGVGGAFVFASQAYYHYFVPVVPFAALLAAPLAVRFLRHGRRTVAMTAIAVNVAWAADITFGDDPSRLFISAPHLSAIHGTVQVLDRSTRPGQRVLTDQLEYAYLAHRLTVADYFWNMGSVLSARYLEHRLVSAGAVVLTERVAPTYPSGFTDYLDRKRYTRVRTGSAKIWLIAHNPASEPRLEASRYTTGKPSFTVAQARDTDSAPGSIKSTGGPSPVRDRGNPAHHGRKGACGSACSASWPQALLARLGVLRLFPGAGA